jgi:hypothetical protein
MRPKLGAPLRLKPGRASSRPTTSSDGLAITNRYNLENEMTLIHSPIRWVLRLISGLRVVLKVTAEAALDTTSSNLSPPAQMAKAYGT